MLEARRLSCGKVRKDGLGWQVWAVMVRHGVLRLGMDWQGGHGVERLL